MERMIGDRRLDLSKQARELGAELEDRPSELVVVTGFAALTPLGDTEETRRRELLGETAISSFNTGNEATKIAAHVEFDPSEHFKRQQLMRISRLSAMMRVVAQEAGLHAGILDEKGKLKAEFNRDLVGSNIATGFGQALNAVNTHKALSRNDRLQPYEGLKVFPEQSNAGVTAQLGLSGWSSNSSEACASGLSSIAEANLLIRNGKNQIMLAGGFEDVFSGPTGIEDGHPEIPIGIFSALTALSERNDDPKHASRPFDKDRDGFVMASGGGVLVLESIESALARGATIYATILGAEKAMDGGSPTNIDSDRVAKMILKTLKVRGEEGYYPVDTIFAHATSTPAGDRAEIESFRRAFDDILPSVPITALKSIHGHLLGGAGAINAISAVRSLYDGVIPPTINLSEREAIFNDLDIVDSLRYSDIQSALAVAYGFGGFDAAVLFGKYVG